MISKTYLIDGKQVRFHGLQDFALFMHLWNRRGGFASKEELIDEIWRGARLPENYLYTICKLVWHAKRSLRLTRFDIESGYNRYRLIRLQPAKDSP